ncbi:MAG TPA: hypothetical protein VME66_10645 [Candidatus Acidoferrales bacterium]|nr:hypothetical protein [Candidatus Acidoferrales bacterium]
MTFGDRFADVPPEGLQHVGLVAQGGETPAQSRGLPAHHAASVVSSPSGTENSASQSMQTLTPG